MDTSVFVDASFDDIAEYYDVDYPETADHEFLRLLASRPGVDSILEVPSGSGRNLPVLCESGVPVVAVDQSPAMVEQVRASIGASGASLHVRPMIADMCTMRLGERFSLIIVPREAFQLIVPLDAAAQALESLALHLHPGGALLIDIAHFVNDPTAAPGIQPDYYSPALADGEVHCEWERLARSGERIRRWRVQQHVSREIYRTTFYYRIERGPGDTSLRALDLEFRTYSPEQLIDLAGAQGLRVKEVYCDYEMNPPHANAARTVAVFTHG